MATLGCLRGFGPALVAVWLGCVAPVQAQTEGPEADPVTVTGEGAAPVAVIGRETITADALDRAVAARGAQFGTDPDAVRDTVLDVLAAEFWVQQNFADTARTTPTIRSALREAERQILFDMFAQSRFDATPPTEAEIDAFIDANPALFAGRVEYRYQRFVISADDGAQAALVPALLEEVPDPPTPEAASDLAAALAGAGLRFERASAWAASEAIPAALLDRLAAMAAEGRTRDVATVEATVEAAAVPGAAETDVLLLFAARPDPVDPALLRDGVAARLVQERYRAHRLTLAAEIAAPLRTAAETGVPPPLGTPMLAALAVLGAGLGLALGAGLAWYRRTGDLFRLARREASDDDLPLLRRPGPVLSLFGLGALAAVVATGAALSTRPAALTSLNGPAIVAGLAILGFGFALLLWRGRAETLEAGRVRQARAGAGAALTWALALGLAALFAFLPGLFLYQ